MRTRKKTVAANSVRLVAFAHGETTVVQHCDDSRSEDGLGLLQVGPGVTEVSEDVPGSVNELIQDGSPGRVSDRAEEVQMSSAGLRVEASCICKHRLASQR